MDLQLKNKCALVTGASRGLGFATARLLAAEGARVAINSRDAAKLAAAAETIGAIAIPADLLEPEAAGKIVGAAVEKLGGLDILICNAGGAPPGAFESF